MCAANSRLYFTIITNPSIFSSAQTSVIMNELDSLRQEAETLKNAIRVSAHSDLYTHPAEPYAITHSKTLSLF